MMLPPWIKPPKDYLPFNWSSGLVNLTADTEAAIGSFRTIPRPLRLFSYGINTTPGPRVRLRILYPGSLGVADFCPFSLATLQAEAPIYAIVPPDSQVFVRFLPRTTETDRLFRLNGWYF